MKKKKALKGIIFTLVIFLVFPFIAACASLSNWPSDLETNFSARVGEVFEENVGFVYASDGRAVMYTVVFEEDEDRGLPPGVELTLDGVLMGNPSEAGEFNFAIEASSVGLGSATQEFTITVGEGELRFEGAPDYLRISEGAEARDFGGMTVAFAEGAGTGNSIRYTLASGYELPDGLRLQLDGQIVGYTEDLGRKTVKVIASSDYVQDASHEFEIEVTEPWLELRPTHLGFIRLGQYLSYELPAPFGVTQEGTAGELAAFNSVQFTEVSVDGRPTLEEFGLALTPNGLVHGLVHGLGPEQDQLPPQNPFRFTVEVDAPGFESTIEERQATFSLNIRGRSRTNEKVEDDEIVSREITIPDIFMDSTASFSIANTFATTGERVFFRPATLDAEGNTIARGGHGFVSADPASGNYGIIGPTTIFETRTREEQAKCEETGELLYDSEGDPVMVEVEEEFLLTGQSLGEPSTFNLRLMSDGTIRSGRLGETHRTTRFPIRGERTFESFQIRVEAYTLSGLSKIITTRLTVRRPAMRLLSPQFIEAGLIATRGEEIGDVSVTIGEGDDAVERGFSLAEFGVVPRGNPEEFDIRFRFANGTDRITLGGQEQADSGLRLLPDGRIVGIPTRSSSVDNVALNFVVQVYEAGGAFSPSAPVAVAFEIQEPKTAIVNGRMEAEHINMSGLSGSGHSNSESGTGMVMITGVTAGVPSSFMIGFWSLSEFVFEFYSATAANLDLHIGMASDTGPFTVNTSNYRITVNGVAHAFPSRSGPGSTGFADHRDIRITENNFGTVSVRAGWNTIVLQTLSAGTQSTGHTGGTIATDHIRLSGAGLSAANLQWRPRLSNIMESPQESIRNYWIPYFER